MRSTSGRLLSTTVMPLMAGFGLVVGSALVEAPGAHAATLAQPLSTPLPAAKPRPGHIQLAACNPCAAKNPCNPCAAKNPCNPCAAKNPCNPCAAGGGSATSKCYVPRLAAARKTSPCNPCNPCAAKNPCNPCAAKNPCNPCAAKNPCGAANPCNPCNPCGAAPVAEVSSEEARAAYQCIHGEMGADYAKAGIAAVADYQKWVNLALAPYQSATHGSRYVNNYVNATGAAAYARYEKVGKMPVGAVLAKDSFVVNPDGRVAIGPLFIMEKLAAGTNADTHDWRYAMIMANGAVLGTTDGKDSANVAFCAECHAAVADDQDSLFFLPDEMRAKFP